MSSIAASPLVFVDIETTHTDPGLRRPWEIALIRREPNGWQKQITILIEDVDLSHADPRALDVGRFYERHPQYAPIPPLVRDTPPSSITCTGEDDVFYLTEAAAAAVVDDWTAPSANGRARFAGYNVWFDADTLDAMLRRHRRLPRWDYHLIDVGNMAAGRLGIAEPMRSYELSRATGAEPPSEAEQHTALGDARWVMRWWDQLTSPVPDDHGSTATEHVAWEAATH
ncbi:hypothetical protein IU459_32705 [Nocardia amamiensis]|uniref:Exonuclease domain-containing protein n=1 Tax=Nocardia amamiensis TaxID=404578 RepID=A0ABS0D0A3_9NOCA|nr:hypothetical protein [Nocardia amamiensis]MBF6302266.1 hypothetical protein [Nocardia amamiensis]